MRPARAVVTTSAPEGGASERAGERIGAWALAFVGLGLGCTATPMEVVEVWEPSGSTGVHGESTGLLEGEDGTTDGDDPGGDSADEGSEGGTTGGEEPELDDDDDGGESDGDEGSTGELADCHPLLVEVVFDPRSNNDGQQWIKLYNPCEHEIDLDEYSLGWGELDYVMGSIDLADRKLDSHGCFVVGGPESDDANGFPTFDQATDLEPDLGMGGTWADGVALFAMDSQDVGSRTVPVDAVIYGFDNDAGLMDSTGNVVLPHVESGPQGSSIRRQSSSPEWIVELYPKPDLCPPY